ncbi:hypothetical protein [Anatilimnocola floriformis]|uniref:hypothetical protein n=1 Tax=Anatilimnocola floriformis TaxID=2948575 RepID=UPI0020C23132|nr:hypothetical protein [Anatilimnocola floriformis]
MNKFNPLSAIILLLSLAFHAIAAEPNMPANAPAANAPAKPAGKKTIREIFVPFDDLQVILESDKNRVFLTREEYEELLKVVEAQAAKQGPVNVVMLQAAYSGKIDDGRAQVTGKLELEVLQDGWQVVSLQLGHVGIKSATLDGKSASLARDARGLVKLFVNGRGKHQLELQLTAAVPAAAALQTLHIALPVATTATFDLSVAGNVEVKGGASVVSRKYNEGANRTDLALLLERGPMSIVMSLNNKQAREQRLVVARTIQVDEITLGYERLHVNVALRILHDPVDRFRFVVPAGFEVTNVSSQRLSRWEVKPDDKGRQILEAVLSEATTDATLIAISANRSPELGQDWLASLQKWKLPRLQPLDVAGEVAVVGLLVEDRLEPQELTTKQLLPIDSPILTQAMPESIFRAEPGAPIVRHVATYYVPAYIDATQYDLSANFVRPESGLVVSTSLLLSLSDQGHDLRGGFIVSPLAEDLFQIRLKAPLGWRVQEVLGDDNQPLPIERYELADGSTRLLVTLRKRIPAGQRGKIIVRASSNPAGWLADWKEQPVTFPQLEIEGATREAGAVAVQTGDDLAVQPTDLNGLVPLLENEKPAQGLAGVTTAAAYRFESRPFAAKFTVERKQPSLAAEVFSFVQVLPDALKAHYELIYQVREARTRQLAFSLPLSTPKEITIIGLDGVQVKEQRSADEGDRRRWIVQLADRQAGEIRLTVDFQQPLAERQLKDYPLPLAQAEDVEFQSAFISLEGSPELEVQPKTTLRTVDEAELYQARYLLDNPAQTGDRRLIGAYGYTGRDGVLKIDVVRRTQHVLPSAIAQRAELLTRISANGLTQSIARYDLVTKATILEVALPGDAVLWTMLVDGQPTKPQKEKHTLLVSLPPREDLPVRRVQIVFETTGRELSLAPTISAAAPHLLLRGSGDETDREVPQADLEWRLILPSGYVLKTSSGSVAPVAKPPREIAALKVWQLLKFYGGGMGPYASASHYMHEDADLSHYLSKATPLDDTSSMPPTAEALPPPGAEAPQAMDPFGAPAPNAAFPVEPALPKSDPKPASQPADNAPPPLPPQAGPQPPPAAKPAEPSMPAKPPIIVQEEPRELMSVVSGRADIFSALEGVSSLPIDFRPARAETIETFRSLGVDPRLEVTLVDSTRIRWAAWGVGLLVFLMGTALTYRPAKNQAGFVVIFLLLSSLPLLLTSELDDLAPVFDAAFYAACALVPYYLIASVLFSLRRAILRRLPADWFQTEATNIPLATNTGTIIAPLLLCLLLLGNSTNAVAQAPAYPLPEGAKAVELKDLLPLLEPGGPVTVPADAVIIPFDANDPDGVAQAKKVLIPYAKFIELWNRAHPDKPKEAKPAPIDFAILAANYEATLAATDDLLVTGKLTIEVLGDKPVAIPLPFSGGVLVKATLDGQPARLQVVAPQPAPAAQQPQQQQDSKSIPPNVENGGVIILHTQGAGRKTAEVSFRLGLTRRGGWRQVAASLPLGGANQLALTIPETATEVRIAGTPDKDNFETKAANEKIETTLVGAGGGRLDLQWRPKVAVGQIDQSLTAKSTSVLDVREDALRLTWIGELNFGRGTRDQFEFSLPLGYSIEQVVSDNIRGWQTKPDAAQQIVNVTLLKPATGSEKITLVLSKRGRIGTGEFATFDAPAVFVSGAALQQGEIMIRRSPRIELRTEAATGLSRADSDGQLNNVVHAADAEDPSILNLRPYQVYRFVTSGAGNKFTLRLNAAETAAATAADVRSVLRVAERETTLESKITFRPQGQPLYHVEVLLPAGFEIDELQPTEVNWSVVNDAASNRKKLSVHLLDGRESEFTLTLLGHFAKREKWEELAAPVISVLGVERQQGEIAVLSDPDTDVQATNLKNAETGLLQQTFGWLKAEQQPLARVALKYRAADYSATFKLTRKTPRVTVRSVSNVKVTRRSIEETMLLEYQITDAGIHELQFMLPESFRTARIRIPQEESLLQRKKITPATENGQPLPGWILVTLSLQDDVTDRLGVIVEQDRLLTDKPQDVAIPRSLTGTTAQRLVVIENVGRDEVVEVNRVGLEPISRQQQAWQEMTRLLGNADDSIVTQAYVVNSDKAPSLTFKTQQNQQVQTAQARIEFARTTLIVDEAGGYRALVVFQVSNSTEQYLDIAIPAGAKLWTAIVRGQPVKPVEKTPAVVGEMRIPLIKTPAGSGDYSVSIRYAGSVGRLRSLRSIDFPLLRTQNINVEQSQVQLYLPDDFEWPHFGGTMSQVKSENELEEGFQRYFNKKVEEAKQSLQSEDLNTKLRAQANLSGLLQTWQFNSASRSANNLEQSGLAQRNYSELQSAQQEAAEQVQMQIDELQSNDNRYRLNGALMEQKVARSKNVVTQLGNNFEAAGAKPDDAKESKGKGELAYNPQFLKGNKLDTEESNKRVIQEELKKTAEQLSTKDQLLPKSREPAAKQPQQGEAPQSRVSRGGKVQQQAKDLNGDRAGLNQQLNDLDQKFETDRAAAIADKERTQNNAGGPAANFYGGRGLSPRGPAAANAKPDAVQNQNPGQGQGQAFNNNEQSKARDNAFRYQQRLNEDQAQQQQALQLPNQPVAPQNGGQQSNGQMGQGQMPGRPNDDQTFGFYFGLSRDGAPQGHSLLGNQIGGVGGGGMAVGGGGGMGPGQSAAAPGSQPATGLASLDIDVPARGRVYLFTIPRGETKITAQPIARDLTARLINLAIVVAIIVVGVVIYRIARQLPVRQATGTIAFANLLILLGMLSVLFSILPIYGFILIGLGIVLLVRRILDMRRAVATA